MALGLANARLDDIGDNQIAHVLSSAAYDLTRCGNSVARGHVATKGDLDCAPVLFFFLDASGQDGGGNDVGCLGRSTKTSFLVLHAAYPNQMPKSCNLSRFGMVVIGPFGLGLERSLISVNSRDVCRRNGADGSCEHYKKQQHRCPLDRRVGAMYSARRAVCPAQGIGLPFAEGAARATRPCVGAVSYGRACRESRKARRILQSGRPIVARPATRIGLWLVGPSEGTGL